MNDIIEAIMKARVIAFNEAIEANTVLINKEFGKVLPFSFEGQEIPPMICGLKAYISKDIPEELGLLMIKSKENEKDLISREALQKEMLRVTLANPDFSHNYAVAVANEIDNAPAVDAVEVVHAKWVDKWKGLYANKLYKCSACKETALADDKGWFLTDYCHNCGARMDGE